MSLSNVTTPLAYRALQVSFVRTIDVFARPNRPPAQEHKRTQKSVSTSTATPLTAEAVGRCVSLVSFATQESARQAAPTAEPFVTVHVSLTFRQTTNTAENAETNVKVVNSV